MPAIDINKWMRSLLAQLQSCRQRQLVSLQGSRVWCDAQFACLLELESTLRVFSNRALVADAIPFSKADGWLGGEAELVIVDLFDGFSPDLLCIAGGLVPAGGVLVLLSPPVEGWDLSTDRYALWQDRSRAQQPWFVEYFFAALAQDTEIGLVWRQMSAAPASPTLSRLPARVIERGQTAEQREILRAIERWMEAGQEGVILLGAERGRGKSSCLGLLINRFDAPDKPNLILSARSRRVAGRVLQLAPTAQFFAPDQLLRTRPAAELVIVDEAAMIPQSMLRQICRLYRRVILATTTGGYEGTGQGFQLRFIANLEPHRLLRLGLEKPVRWADGDRLETWLNRVLMLNAGKERATPPALDAAACQIRLIAVPGEPREREVVRQVYALLCSAHYRTRPSDLRMLLENPDLRLIVASSEGQVAGAALLNNEGGLDADLCREIHFGRRRPQGHLLAQMLTAQTGVPDFARHRGVRIMRIAVASSCRRRGLGTRLIEHALGYAQADGQAYLGASFALDAETTAFWQENRFTLVHVGFGEGKSSGNQSIGVLRPLDAPLEAVSRQLRDRVEQQLPLWMTQFLSDLDGPQVAALLRICAYRGEFSELEMAEVRAFARGHRGIELCFASLQKFVMHRVAQMACAPERLLLEKAVQNRDWALLERTSNAEGRKHLLRRLRPLVDALIKDC